MQIDTEHAAFLRAMARNTNDKLCQKAYADYLMEQGSAGWIIVLNYRIHEWPVWTKGTPLSEYGWRLPWLDGTVEYKGISHHLQRIKYILNAYAAGKVK